MKATIAAGSAAIALAAALYQWLGGDFAARAPAPPATMPNEAEAFAGGRSLGGNGIRTSKSSAGPMPDQTPPQAEQQLWTAPSPPPGYQFVGFAGEMAKGRMDSGADKDPSHGERARTLEWLGAPSAVHDLAAQAERAGRNWTFGWVRLAEHANPADAATQLARYDATALDSAGRLLRVRVPGDVGSLNAIAALPAIDALGAMPAEARLGLAEKAAGSPNGPLPVFVALMTDDPDGRYGRALANVGLAVKRFDAAIRVYTGELPAARLPALAALDFVQAIELIGVVRALHDTAVPAMGVDLLRTHDGVRFLGVDGASVPIGVMDTGLNARHIDIVGGRLSVCGANLVEGAGEDEDLWIDEDGHGTHVTGTVAGAGLGDSRFAGMAPGVRHIRFAKSLNRKGSGQGDSILAGMDYLAERSACDAGESPQRVKPLVVNMSIAACSLDFEGRTTGERKLDATVWGERQLYVVSNDNSGAECFGDYAAAKNSLAVGAIRDDGMVADFSSHGPTADGRLIPSISATGVGVRSPLGGGSRSGYVSLSGTSMASPTMAGVAALLMDAAPEHRNNPALARARLLASAIRPDPWLDAASAFPATNTAGPGAVQAAYGLGKGSAAAAILQRDDPNGWATGSAVATLDDGEYGHIDIEVPAGASRLDVVMTWDEPATEVIADPVLNDLDLWLDQAADCGAAACGEHSSRSRIDNVEWIIVRNPQAGTWRVKVTAPRVYTAPPRAAVAWTLIRGPAMPKLAVDVEARSTGRRRTRVAATLSTDGYIAAATQLAFGCRSPSNSSHCNEVSIESVSTRRDDGIHTYLHEEIMGSDGSDLLPGAAIPIGELVPGRPRRVDLTLSHPPVDGLLLMFTASAWNGVAASSGAGIGDRNSIPAMPSPPENDAFDQPAELAGASGSQTVDLLRSTPDAAGPGFDGSSRRPVGTVWYRWTAPSGGLAAFSIDELQGFNSHRLDVYRGDEIAALERVAAGAAEVQFLAEAGVDYRIRLSHVGSGLEVTLRWRPGERPAHDNLADAVAVDGETGEYQSSNAGATLEAGEWVEGTVATTWHRWTAPADGWWVFERAGRSNVAVFEGDGFDNLRLVSGFEPRRSYARFPAAAGREYRIMVGGTDAFNAVGAYKLTWRPADSPWDQGSDNDEVGAAQPLSNEAAAQHQLLISPSMTVSPGEPLETGVMTGWWTWTAPAPGRYAWRNSGHANVRIGLFTGAADDLRMVGGIDPHAQVPEATVSAEAGQRFWISGGFAARGRGAWGLYPGYSANPTLRWGPVADNDEYARARPLSGSSGVLEADNLHASTAPGEWRDGLGRSTLWWSYEAAETAWLRLEIQGEAGPWSLAVLREDDTGVLEIVRSSRWRAGSGDGAELRFHAREGERYAIVVGVHGESSGGPFRLRWSSVDAPAWLRLVGQLPPWGTDARGEVVELREPTGLAVNGAALYVASEPGLQVFEFDPETDALTLRQTLEGDLLNEPMVWDETRGRLLMQTESCDEWRVFEPTADGLRLSDGGVLASPGDESCLRQDRLFITPDGANLYRGNYGGTDIYELEADGGITYVGNSTAWNEGMASSSDGGFLYAIDLGTMSVLRRGPARGDLEYVDTITVADGFVEALGSDDEVLLLLFADFGGGEPRGAVYALGDPAVPRLIGKTPLRSSDADSRGFLKSDCAWVGSRPGVSSADAVCSGVVFTFQWDTESGEIRVTDYLTTSQADWYDTPLPPFQDAVAAAAGGDGRHVFVVTRQHGILVFRRIGQLEEP